VENAPSHSGLFLNVPLERERAWQSARLSGSKPAGDFSEQNLAGAGMARWAGRWPKHCCESARFSAAAGPRWGCVGCHSLSWKGWKCSINN